jgi:hypothetical protein
MSRQPSGDASGDRWTSRSTLKRKRQEKKWRAEREEEWAAADREAKREQPERARRRRADKDATELTIKRINVINNHEEAQSTEGLKRAAARVGKAVPTHHTKFPVSVQGQARDVPREVVDHSEPPELRPEEPAKKKKKANWRRVSERGFDTPHSYDWFRTSQRQELANMEN